MFDNFTGKFYSQFQSCNDYDATLQTTTSRKKENHPNKTTVLGHILRSILTTPLLYRMIKMSKTIYSQS